MKKIKLYLNHDVSGYYHLWGMSPAGTASEEIEVELPDGVEVIDTYLGEAFEYKGDITRKILNKHGKNGWPRPYLLFVTDGNFFHYKYCMCQDFLGG